MLVHMGGVPMDVKGTASLLVLKPAEDGRDCLLLSELALVAGRSSVCVYEPPKDRVTLKV